MLLDYFCQTSIKTIVTFITSFVNVLSSLTSLAPSTHLLLKNHRPGDPEIKYPVVDVYNHGGVRIQKQIVINSVRSQDNHKDVSCLVLSQRSDCIHKMVSTGEYWHYEDGIRFLFCRLFGLSYETDNQIWNLLDYHDQLYFQKPD
jgi:hypothetical protein